MHGAFKAFRVNRAAILRFITEHCLTENERKGISQNIIYKPDLGVVCLGVQYDNRYETTIFSARGLLQQYLKLRYK